MKNVREMPNGCDFKGLSKVETTRADTQNTVGPQTQILGGLHVKEEAMSLALWGQDTDSAAPGVLVQKCVIENRFIWHTPDIEMA